MAGKRHPACHADRASLALGDPEPAILALFGLAGIGVQNRRSLRRKALQSQRASMAGQATPPGDRSHIPLAAKGKRSANSTGSMLIACGAVTTAVGGGNRFDQWGLLLAR